MADARQFINPDLAANPPKTEKKPPQSPQPRPTPGPYRRPGARAPEAEEPIRERENLPPQFDFSGADLLKLLDGLTQTTVLAGLPPQLAQYEGPAKLRDVAGKILDQMGFPEDLLPAEAFNPQGRWKILAGCILAYAGIGVYQALQQRKLAMALIRQQMANQAAQQQAGERPAPTEQAPRPKEEDNASTVGDTTDSGHDAE